MHGNDEVYEDETRRNHGLGRRAKLPDVGIGFSKASGPSNSMLSSCIEVA